MYVIQYRAKSGRDRFAFVDDAGENGYSCADAPGAGTLTFQSRNLVEVLRFSISHSAWPTYSSLALARRWLRRDRGVYGGELREVVLYATPSWAPRAWEVAE